MKKKPIKQWIIPMRWEYRGHAVVEAATADEAVVLAESGEFDKAQLSESQAELINWQVTGEATENK